MRGLARDDLDHVLTRTSPDIWAALRGQRVLITGGSGFVGSWLCETLAWANRALGLEARAVVLDLDVAAFRGKLSHLAGDPAVSLLEGDLASCPFPPGAFGGVIHAATRGYPGPEGAGAVARLELEWQGTRRVLELARDRGAKLLYLSSGAIYGRQPPTLARLDESCSGSPDPTDTRAGYAHAKRLSEVLCASYGQEHSVSTTIARCFALVGPRLPLDHGFAVGNFIGDALAGKPIHVRSDGTPRRSYLYAADLAIWLWTLWARGAAGRAYNVGSEADVAVSELAREVARVIAPAAVIQIDRAPALDRPAERYVPSTLRARDELGLREYISLGDAIGRTAAWCRQP